MKGRCGMSWLVLLLVLLTSATPSLRMVQQQVVMHWPHTQTGVFELTAGKRNTPVILSRIEKKGTFLFTLPDRPLTQLSDLSDELFNPQCRRIIDYDSQGKVAFTRAYVRIGKQNVTAVLTEPKAKSVTVFTYVYASGPVSLTGLERCADHVSLYQLNLKRGWNLIETQVTPTKLVLRTTRGPKQHWKPLMALSPQAAPAMTTREQPDFVMKASLTMGL